MGSPVPQIIWQPCKILNSVPDIQVIFFLRFTGETQKGKDDDGEEAPTGLSLVAATMKHMKKNYQQLLIPITIWSGLEQGFFGADFTAVRHTIHRLIVSLANPPLGVSLEG